MAGRILVVDDDEAIRDAVRDVLHFGGYEVFTAADGQQGLDVLRAMPRPCLILLDLMMPVLDGWQFAEELERDPALSTVPVVLLTAYADAGRPVRQHHGLITKPFDLKLLLDVAKQHCGAGVRAAD